jgi:hypothetical protein
MRHVFNFVRVHQTLYEASDGRWNVGHVQSIEEIVSLLEQ